MAGRRNSVGRDCPNTKPSRRPVWCVAVTSTERNALRPIDYFGCALHAYREVDFDVSRWSLR
jgi:hypothetical protein